jgi:hypothetical protein
MHENRLIMLIIVRIPAPIPRNTGWIGSKLSTVLNPEGVTVL